MKKITFILQKEQQYQTEISLSAYTSEFGNIRCQYLKRYKRNPKVQGHILQIGNCWHYFYISVISAKEFCANLTI